MIIYKTTNLVNGKIYIGKDSLNNPNYFGSGLILERAIKKYGINNFKKEIIEQCSSLEELDKKEVFWINQLKSTNRKIGYNISVGGTGGDTFSNQSEKKKKEILKKRENSLKPIWGNKEYRKKLSERSKRMWQNPTHRKLIKKLLAGREIKWKDKIGKSNKKIWKFRGDIRSEETKKRVAEILRVKMTGKELKPLSNNIKQQIVKLYETIGPKLIEKQLRVSRYLITNFLKKEGIYQKWQKGIGEKSKKQCSISRCGRGNPMWKKA